MKILVGVPVFRVRDLVKRSLSSLIGASADVLVIDNNADPDIKLLLRREFEGKVYTKSNDENRYCNGAWNQIMEYGLHSGYDVIGLGSSDVIMHSGWDKVLQECAKRPKEVWLPRIGEPCVDHNYKSIEVVTEGVAGYFTFFPREAVEMVYPIPNTLRLWFGDQYMFEKLRHNGWSTVIVNDMRAYHQQSAITARVPEAQEVIRQDKIAWEKLQQV